LPNKRHSSDKSQESRDFHLYVLMFIYLCNAPVVFGALELFSSTLGSVSTAEVCVVKTLFFGYAPFPGTWRILHHM